MVHIRRAPLEPMPNDILLAPGATRVIDSTDATVASARFAG